MPKSPAAPRVTVVIPAYNASQTLPATLASVVGQTFRDWEAVVVDDGSTDATRALAEAFPDRRVRVVHQQNRGLPGARNTGIRTARGTLIGLLDADDLWHPEKLAEHVAHLDRAPRVGVSFSPSELIDGDGAPLRYRQQPRLSEIDAAHVLCRNPVGNGSAPVIRKAVFDEIGFPDPRHGETAYFDETLRQSEDVECWVRIADTTRWSFEGLAAPLTLYRIHGGALSADISEQFRTWEQMLAKVESFAPALVAEHGGRARAYQLRYLARRAVRSRDPRRAFRLMKGALGADWRILRDEAPRTLSTAAAIALLNLVPAGLYDRLERGAMGAHELWSTRGAVSADAAMGRLV